MYSEYGFWQCWRAGGGLADICFCMCGGVGGGVADRRLCRGGGPEKFFRIGGFQVWCGRQSSSGQGFWQGGEISEDLEDLR